MAAAEQIKSLIKSFGEGNEARFFATAMQIAASEAKSGHTTFAKELKNLIDKAKTSRNEAGFHEQKIVQLSPLKRELDGLLDVIQPKIKLNDMVLDESVMSVLQKVILEQKKFDELRKAGLSPRRKLLLEGEPGCGKTMTAHALAGELGISLFVVRLDGLISKFMGETISKLQLIFEAIRSFRAVYLFDEFDSIGTFRNQGNDVGEIRRVLNSFLINIEKDDSNSIIIAATNLPESLDKALYRRFDEIVRYPEPERNQIRELLERLLHEFKLKGQLPIEDLVNSASGLNYAIIVRAVEDGIKEMILNGNEKISELTIRNFLLSRKNNR